MFCITSIQIVVNGASNMSVWRGCGEIGKCPLHGEVMIHVGYVDIEKSIYLAECHTP